MIKYIKSKLWRLAVWWLAKCFLNFKKEWGGIKPQMRGYASVKVNKEYYVLEYTLCRSVRVYELTKPPICQGD